MSTRFSTLEFAQRLGKACLVVCAAWAMAAATSVLAQSVEDAAKSAQSVTTIGPAVPLPAAQRAALAAKRAATIVPTPHVEMAPVKPAPISTIPPAVTREGVLPNKAAAGQMSTSSQYGEAARETDASIEAFVAALGPELALRIGLIKPGEGGSAFYPASAPVRLTAPRGVR